MRRDRRYPRLAGSGIPQRWKPICHAKPEIVVFSLLFAIHSQTERARQRNEFIKASSVDPFTPFNLRQGKQSFRLYPTAGSDASKSSSKSHRIILYFADVIVLSINPLLAALML